MPVNPRLVPDLLPVATSAPSACGNSPFRQTYQFGHAVAGDAARSRHTAAEFW